VIKNACVKVCMRAHAFAVSEGTCEIRACTSTHSCCVGKRYCVVRHAQAVRE
jgi:hypothetical protein